MMTTWSFLPFVSLLEQGSCLVMGYECRGWRVCPLGITQIFFPRSLRYFEDLERKGGLDSAAGDRIWMC